MNSTQNLNHDETDPSTGGIGLQDICYTVFRHQWMILGFVCAGILAAALVPIVHPAPYVSWVKLMIPYVVERNTATLSGSQAQVTATQMGAQGAINTEIEILKSANVAMKAAETVGPARILAKRGGGNDL